MTASISFLTALRTTIAQAAVDACGATGAKAKLYAGTQKAGTTAPGSTTLNGTITSGATTLVLTSATGFPASGNYTLFCENEQMTVTAGQGTTNLTVTRGVNGTTAASHTSGVTVTDELLLATLNWATTKIGTVTNGVIAIDSVDMTQTSSNHVAGTPTFVDFTTSADAVQIRVPIGGVGFTLSGTVVNGQNVTLSSLTLTAGNP